eukprot:618790-Lingulodinium_polyedra.AAC.1
MVVADGLAWGTAGSTATGAECGRPSSAIWHYHFEVDWATVVQAHQLGWVEGAAVSVYWGLVYLGGSMVGCDGPVMSWQQYTEGMTSKAEVEGPGQSSRAPGAGSSSMSALAESAKAEVLAQRPWLAAFMEGQEQAAS